MGQWRLLASISGLALLMPVLLVSNLCHSKLTKEKQNVKVRSWLLGLGQIDFHINHYLFLAIFKNRSSHLLYFWIYMVVFLPVTATSRHDQQISVLDQHPTGINTTSWMLFFTEKIESNVCHALICSAFLPRAGLCAICCACVFVAFCLHTNGPFVCSLSGVCPGSAVYTLKPCFI